MTVKMAIPNKGRLNERSIELITKAGINLGDDWGRKLNIKVPDLDLEVFFVRAQDIPIFIDSGAVDFGITGQDVTAEAGKELKNVLNLRFGQCRLSIAAPEESAIARTGKMEDGIRVATTWSEAVAAGTCPANGTTTGTAHPTTDHIEYYTTPQALHLQLTADETICLFDTTGKCVYRETLPAGTHDIDLGKGFYVLKTSVRTYKIVIS